MLRNCLITELHDTPPSRNRIRFYTSRGKDLCITCILRTGSGLLQSDHVVEAVPPYIVGAGAHTSWAQASMHRGRRRPCIVGAGAHTSWAQAPIHRGRRLPCIVEAGFHASWKQASMHRGSRRSCIVGAGTHTSWARAPMHRELISTKSYRVKYNTGSGYDPSLLRNAQPVRGYAGLLRNMS
jgi:hypothetical protein